MNRINRVASVTLLCLLGLLAGHDVARAQVYQPYWNARAVSDDSPAMGLAVGFGEDMFRIAGHARFSMTWASDLGLELVFDNFEDAIGDDSQLFGFGGDYKYLLVTDGTDLPFDLAAQAGFGMEFGDGDFRAMTIPFGILGSKAVPVEDGNRVITPFAGMYLVIEDTNYSDVDLSAEVRFGSAFQITGSNHAFASLHVGNGTMFFLGFTAAL